MDIIKLIKTVYSERVFVSYATERMNFIAEPLQYESTNPIFRRSYFTFVVDRLIPELQSSIIDIPAIYNVSKLKIEGVEVDELSGGISLFDIDGKSHVVAARVKPDRYSEICTEVMSRMDPFYETLKMKGWIQSSVSCSSDIITRLIDYDTVTIRDDFNPDVAIILTAKCFPNIKKCQAITVDWASNDEDERFHTIVASQYMDGIVFRMQVEALKC